MAEIKGSLSNITALGDNPYSSVFSGFNDRVSSLDKYYQELDRKRKEDEAKKAKQAPSKPESNFLTDAVGTVANLSKSIGNGGINPLANVNEFVGGIGAELGAGTRRSANAVAQNVFDATGGANAESNRVNTSNQQTVAIIKSLGDKLKNAKTDDEKNRYKTAIQKVMAISNGEDQSLQQNIDQRLASTDVSKNIDIVGSIARLSNAQGATDAFGKANNGQVAVDEKWLASQNKEIDRALKAGDITQGRANDLRHSAMQRVDQTKKALLANPDALVTGENQSKGVMDVGNVAASIGSSTLVNALGKKLGEAGFEGIKDAFKLNQKAPSVVTPTGNRQLDETLAKAEENVTKLQKGTDIAQSQIDASKQAKEGNTLSPWKQRWNSTRRAVGGQDNMLVREDAKYQKLTGKSEDDLIANDQSLVTLFGRSLHHNHIVDDIIKTKQETGQSVEDILKKYPEGTPEADQLGNYLNNRFAAEVFKKTDGKQDLIPGYTQGQINSAIRDYEKANPEAKLAAKTVKQFADGYIDYNVAAKAIDPETAKYVKNRYKTYVPLERIFDENFAAPSISGGIKTNVARDRVIQSLEGSDRPLETGLGRIVSRANQATGQALKSQFDNEILRRTREGTFSGGKLTLDPEVSAKVAELRDLHGLLNEESKRLTKERQKIVTSKKVATAKNETHVAESKFLREKVISKTRSLLRTLSTQVDREPQVAETVAAWAKRSADARLQRAIGKDGKPIDQTKTLDQVKAEIEAGVRDEAEERLTGTSRPFKDVAPLADKMADKDVVTLSNVLNSTNTGKLGSVLDKLEAKYGELANVRENILSLRQQAEDLSDINKGVKAAKKDIRDELFDIRQDPAKGNIMTGIENGQKYEIQLSPEWADALVKLTDAGEKSGFERNWRKIANVPKTFWTNGFFAPIFTVLKPVREEAMILANNKAMSAYGARALKQLIVPDKDLLKAVIQRGAVPENFTQTINDSAVTALKIGARGKTNVKGKINYIRKDTPMAAKDFFHALGGLSTFVSNRQRARVMKGAYINATHHGYNHEQAVNVAANAYNEVMGNFNRVSRFARDMEPLFMYSSAFQAGTRTTLHTVKTRPVEAAIKATAMTGIAGGTAYLSMSSPAGVAYYKDMYENKQAYNIENYLTFVTPGAYKDDKNVWHGVFRTPILPDFRPFNKAINSMVYDTVTGSGVNPMEIAAAGFDYVTGNYFASNGKEAGIDGSRPFTDHPAVQSIGILAGRDFRNNRDINRDPSKDSEFVSDAGKAIGGLFGGSGAQGDALLSMGGITGQSIKKNDVASTVTSTLGSQLGYGGVRSSQNAVQTNLTSLIQDKSAVSSAITKAIKDGNDFAADELTHKYNDRVDQLEAFVAQGSSTRRLTTKQKDYLSKLRLPTTAGGDLSDKSKESRRKS